MKKQPNILWYCTDQQRFDTIGALGNPHVRTPVIDSLVRDGVAFTHTYCQSPICTPSRSSLMTGLYPSRLHNTRNGNGTFPEHPPLITRLIADAGYDGGLVGKFHLQSAGYRTEPRLDDGFRFWKFSHAPRDDWKEGHDYADWVRERGGDLNGFLDQDGCVPTEFHQTTWASEMAMEFIEQDRPEGQPWLLNVNTYDPHPPFIPPREYAEKFDPAEMPGPHYRPSDLAQQEALKDVDFQGTAADPESFKGREIQALYYAMIAQIDDQFARILESLDRSGQRDNTVIIFTSDHGESLGDHGLVQKGCRFYEGLVRVPLIISCPALFQSGVQADGLVELLDLTATLLDLAGVPQPEYMQGQSLLPVLTGAVSGEQLRDSVRSEYFDGQDSVHTGGKGTFGTMFRDERYKLSLYHDVGIGELYDMKSDPWEFENLWDDPNHQQLRADLMHRAFDSHVVLTTDVGAPRIAPM
jgi:arylsulfatase